MPAPTPTRLVGDLAQTSVGLTGAETQVMGLMDWTIDWKRKFVDSVTTDDIGHETNLPSLDSWTVKAKYAYIDGDASQASNILAALQTYQTPLKWNFFPTSAVGRDSWSGTAAVESCTIAAGTGKLVALDITLKGSGGLTRTPQLAPLLGVDQN